MRHGVLVGVWGFMAVLLAAAPTAVAGTQDRAIAERIAAVLSRDSTVASELFQRHPGILDVIGEDFWEAALLHGPLLPGSSWRVHDLRRPRPPRIEPGDCVASDPPSDAIRLFDGGGLDAWAGERLGAWSVQDAVLSPSGLHANRISTRLPFADVQLRLEYRMPEPAQGIWQYRGNSGVFLQGRYEIQILDGWENPTYPDGMHGAIYGQTPPLVDVSAPPGRWQCMDIVYRAPRFESDRLVAPARVTVLLNGAFVQDATPILGPTRFGAVGAYEKHGPSPLALQDHGDAGSRIVFRQIWARPLASELGTARP